MCFYFFDVFFVNYTLKFVKFIFEKFNFKFHNLNKNCPMYQNNITLISDIKCISRQP